MTKIWAIKFIDNKERFVDETWLDKKIIHNKKQIYKYIELFSLIKELN
jgi:hypothetical protein